MSAWFARFWPLVLLVVLQGLFLAWPEIDLAVSNLFFSPQGGFTYADHWLVKAADLLFGKLHVVLLLLLPWLLLASAYWGGAGEARLRRRLWFLLLVVALAPGLVFGVLKPESGRARPVAVDVYGGDRHFTGAFQPAAECSRSCSFVSGHATAGFLLIGLAWVLGDRRWLWFGIGAGCLAGLARVVEGAHFFSDVLFSYWVVYGVCVLAARLLFGTARIGGARDS